MNVRRAVSNDDTIVLRNVAVRYVPPYAYKRWYRRSVASLLQRRFLDRNPGGELVLAGPALKEFGPQAEPMPPKRTFRMSRTRAARVQDP